MQLRSIAIIILMASIVILTSAFGAYQDGIEKQKELEFKNEKRKENEVKKTSSSSFTSNSGNVANNIVGASGAGTSYKQSQSYLNVAEKIDRPHVKDGPNEYRGKVGGYELRNSDDSSSESEYSDDDNIELQSEFQKKLKYINTIFEEIFSKWNSQEPIMGPTSVEDPDNAIELGGTIEGLRIREKFKRHSRQGMRKLKNAFRRRFK